MVAVVKKALRQDAIPRGVYTRDDIHGDTILDADVAIVGSGAGGATLAAELVTAYLERHDAALTRALEMIA